VAHTHVRTTGATNGGASDASTSNNKALTVSGAALTVFGRILQNQGATMGSYSDTVSMTINF
jgi:spore coat protein U-like protein